MFSFTGGHLPTPSELMYLIFGSRSQSSKKGCSNSGGSSSFTGAEQFEGDGPGWLGGEGLQVAQEVDLSGTIIDSVTVTKELPPLSPGASPGRDRHVRRANSQSSRSRSGSLNFFLDSVQGDEEQYPEDPLEGQAIDFSGFAVTTEDKVRAVHRQLKNPDKFVRRLQRIVKDGHLFLIAEMVLSGKFDFLNSRVFAPEMDEFWLSPIAFETQSTILNFSIARHELTGAAAQQNDCQLISARSLFYVRAGSYFAQLSKNAARYRDGLGEVISFAESGLFNLAYSKLVEINKDSPQPQVGKLLKQYEELGAEQFLCAANLSNIESELSHLSRRYDKLENNRLLAGIKLGDFHCLFTMQKKYLARLESVGGIDPLEYINQANDLVLALKETCSYIVKLHPGAGHYAAAYVFSELVRIFHKNDHDIKHFTWSLSFVSMFRREPLEIAKVGFLKTCIKWALNHLMWASEKYDEGLYAKIFTNACVARADIDKLQVLTESLAEQVHPGITAETVHCRREVFDIERARCGTVLSS